MRKTVKVIKKDDQNTKVSQVDLAYANRFSKRKSLRRWFVIISIISASIYLPYSWLNQNTAAVRFSVIVVLEVDGEVKEYSNVMQVEYTRYDQVSGLGYGGSTKTWGEALVIDLGNRGRAYMLIDNYPASILRSYNVRASVGSLKPEHLHKLRGLNSEIKWNYTNYFTKKKILYPKFIAFKNENDPNSIFEIKERNFNEHFGEEVKFLDLRLSITDEEITKGVLVKYLPWLSKKYKSGFERVPSGPDIPPREEWPLRWTTNYNSFYAGESR